MLVDNGLMMTRHSIPDLDGIAIRFAPAGDHLYAVSRAPAVLDPDFGPELTFGFPGVPFPGDDDSQEIAFPAGFPFLGGTWPSVWVNAFPRRMAVALGWRRNFPMPIRLKSLTTVTANGPVRG